jgi:DNA-binding transcriptional ArsR family regulator
MNDRIFSALADPTRRAVLERLVARPQTVGQIASELPVSRPAVSQHLKVLKDAGLVTDEARGTNRVYRLDPQGLGPLRRWLDEQWEQSLANFKSLAEEDDGK